ncbi:2-hydroxychromene-2-carboxylate isomerase [Bradyrhizobium sp. LHD-71]|uniref:2-hydroxychromene-2-carboxylate isomerase n=1 Tax=Bradyrhizobium sp. LHD-71 TaxID=3072141 RepID=UPI00280E8100|nr:2-hydroxychromene-2-carboxylate isomerase [Bradyrhizobium sp. LHD-71]MDQ8730401.1 2-hydroxychromene-2-carboxylate isomerase [Bradyrhizobium sp. LHD-71]
MARQIDYYFSAASPWAYIGHAVFQDLAGSHGCKVVYKPVFLGELFAETGGLPLAKRHPARQRYRMMELQRWREKRGLNFHLQPQHWPFDPKLADGVVIAANVAGLDPEPFMRRMFKGVWEDQLDLGDAATVADVAGKAGLPGEKLISAALSPEIATIYEQNRQDAIAIGVFGSPGYVLDGEVFWGQDRIELLGDVLRSGRKPYQGSV